MVVVEYPMVAGKEFLQERKIEPRAGQQVPQAESESVWLQVCSPQAHSARASSPRELWARCSLLSAQSP
jgi:hypothetical protein